MNHLEAYEVVENMGRLDDVALGEILRWIEAHDVSGRDLQVHGQPILRWRIPDAQNVVEGVAVARRPLVRTAQLAVVGGLKRSTAADQMDGMPSPRHARPTPAQARAFAAACAIANASAAYDDKGFRAVVRDLRRWMEEAPKAPPLLPGVLRREPACTAMTFCKELVYEDGSLRYIGRRVNVFRFKALPGRIRFGVVLHLEGGLGIFKGRLAFRHESLGPVEELETDISFTPERTDHEWNHRAQVRLRWPGRYVMEASLDGKLVGKRTVVVALGEEPLV